MRGIRRIGMVGLVVSSLAGAIHAEDTVEEAAKGLLVVHSRLNYYTAEQEGQLLVRMPVPPEGNTCIFEVVCDDEVPTTAPIVFGERPTIFTFPLEVFRRGDTTLQCRVLVDDTAVAETTAVVRKLPHKPNVVKIDRLTGGVIVDGRPFFPFGFYCYSPVQPRLAEEEVVRGFSMMSPYQDNEPETLAARQRYMDRCARLGMKVHYQLLSVAGGGGVHGADPKEATKRRALLEAEIKAFRDHPALLAWYIADEPTGSKVPPERLAESRALINKLDPYHPVTVVFMNPGAAQRYADSMDIVMTDIYPIPHGPPAGTGDAVQLLVNEFSLEKPIWFVPQAFGGGEWWRREPTAQEERVMTYLPVIRGATGIQYFIRHGQNGFPKSTSAWAECGRLALEIAELAPALLSDEPRPEVVCTPTSVAAAGWQDRGLVTILAVNTLNAPIPAHIELEGVGFTGVAILPFENRTVPVQGGVIEEMIDAYGTRAYQFRVRPLDEDLAIHAGNLVENPSFENNPSVGTPAGCYANVGAGRGATYFVDPSVARHGRHAVRMHTPAQDQGVSLGFFPFSLEDGTPFRVSVWAKGKPLEKMDEPPGFFGRLFKPPKAKPGPPTFTVSFVAGANATFELSPDWHEYVLTGQTDQGYPRVAPGIAFNDPGTAWFDLLEVIVDPAITAEPDEFVDRIEVTVNTIAKRGKIRYTLDGTDPTASSVLYTGPITLTDSATVRAAVFDEGRFISGVARAAFTKGQP